MHVKNDYGHRDGDRYATLEKLQLVLALETSAATNKPAADDDDVPVAIAVNGDVGVLHSCCCLLPCPPECTRNRSKTSQETASSSSLSALHATILEAADRHADDQRAAWLVNRIDDALRSGIDVNVKDARGETALSYVKILLRKGCYRLACQAAAHLIERGAWVDAEDNGRQTLLSHSVASLDAASELTRLLLNKGADVWHKNSGGGGGGGGDSPFGTFLQAVVRCRCVDGARVTADLLGRTMGARPEAFRSLVLRSMVRHGRCVRVLGPVFVQLKSILSPYWRQPQPLRYAAWTVIRKQANSSRSWTQEFQQLGLPPPILRYLTMED